jgi:hypothetical protein
MNPKEKASDIFFKVWFEKYNKLHKDVYSEAQHLIDIKILKEKENSDYWKQVRNELLSFKG